MATQRFSTNLGLSVFPEIDSSQHKSIFNDALRVRQAIQILQGALDKYTGALGPDSGTWSQLDPVAYNRVADISRVYVKASEAIVAGAMVNLYNNAGVLNARNASAAAAGKPARAFCSIAVASGDVGEFILLGINPLIGGMVPGTVYYLSNTAGAISSAAGTVSQKIGFAVNATKLHFNPELII